MTVYEVVKGLNRSALRTVFNEANDFGTRMHDNLKWAAALGRLAAEAAFVDLLMRTAEEDFQKANDTDTDNTDTDSLSLLDRQDVSCYRDMESGDNPGTLAQKQL